MKAPHPAPVVRSRGFTLIELLVAAAVLLIIMGVLLQLTGGMGQIWKTSTGKISAFQNARSAFSTISSTLAKANLNTYNDYVDSGNNYRTAANSATFSPVKFLRASELHFISGPAADLIQGADAIENPGDAIFFQAPMGETEQTSLTKLNRTLNTVGFYVQYGTPDDTLLPTWMKTLFGVNKRFRLIQVIEPTEDLEIYNSTATAGYDRNWLKNMKLSGGQPDGVRARVLAEDVSLLIIRPRLSPQDEESVAPTLSATFNDDKQGSILSPDYNYDSRAWETSYTGGITPASRVEIMRNQLPPIIDVAMVSVDRRSLARLDTTSDTPPAALQVPSGLFTDSSKLEEDLNTYGQQLSDAKIRYRIFRTSVEVQGAKWSNLN